MTPTEQARAILAKHVTLCEYEDCVMCRERHVLIADIAEAIALEQEHTYTWEVSARAAEKQVAKLRDYVLRTPCQCPTGAYSYPIRCQCGRADALDLTSQP